MSPKPQVALWGRVWTALIVVLVLARLPITAGADDMLIDGGYYTDIARNVRDGLGLVSNVSLYHAGFEHFPHPTSVYPLWPLLYGYVARVLPLELVGHWLPTLGYAVALFGAWRLGRAWDPLPLFPRHVPGLHFGHVLALMLGLHREFLLYTALPYTEGLAWALLMLALLRMVDLFPRGGVWAGVELGVWVGLLVLARAQLVLVGMAAGLGLLLFCVFGEDRRRTVAMTAAAGLTGAGLIGLHLGWVRTWMPGATPLDLLRFDQVRVNDLLAPVEVLASADGAGAWIGARLVGLVQAWDLVSAAGYRRAFFTFHWALPFALPIVLGAALREIRRHGLRGALGRLARPERRFAVVIVLLAMGGLASIHLPQKVYNGEWYFHRRQALVCLPAFAWALWLLLRSSRPGLQAAGIVVLSSGLVMGATSFVDRVDASLDGEPLFEGADHADLVDWLEDRRRGGGPLVVAAWAQHPQRLAWQTEQVGYHWFYEGTRYADLRTLFERLGARYLLVDPDRTGAWRFRRDPRFAEEFERLDARPGGVDVYVWSPAD